MNVLHVVPAITEEASGPSYSVLRLCETMIAQGQEIELATLAWAPMAVPPVFMKTFPLGLGPRRLGRSPTMHRSLEASAGSHRIDIIHNHSLWMMPNIYAGRVAQRHRTPLMVAPRGTLSEWAMRSGSVVKRLFWPLIQRPALAATTCFHATAKSEFEDIRRMGFRQPIAIIPNGIDIPQLSSAVDADSRTLLFLGRIHPVKGLDMLLPAWQVVQDRFPDWRLRIVGPDNAGYLTEMKRLASELRLERIEFSGPILGAQKWRAYQQAELFVLPTYSENFGIAVAEALASGIPVIATKGAPWGGLVENKAGWWIDIGIASLVSCLEVALATPSSQLAQMGQAGRRWMSAEYAWTQVGQKMAETYQWMLKRASKPDWVIED